MDTDFDTWLIAELERRGWNNSELARRAGVVPSTVSMILSRQNRPGFDFCVKVARAFRLSPEEVLRRAGLLPSIPPAVAEEQEAVRILRSLQVSVRATVITMLRALARAQGTPVGVGKSGVTYEIDDAETRELLEEYALVPAEWRGMAVEQLRQYQRMDKMRPRFIGEEESETERAEETE